VDPWKISFNFSRSRATTRLHFPSQVGMNTFKPSRRQCFFALSGFIFAIFSAQWSIGVFPLSASRHSINYAVLALSVVSSSSSASLEKRSVLIFPLPLQRRTYPQMLLDARFFSTVVLDFIRSYPLKRSLRTCLRYPDASWHRFSTF